MPPHLTEAQRARLIGRLRQRRAGPPRPTIERVPRPAVLPTSFAQQRLWVAHQLSARPAAYNTGAVFRLRGPLRPAALAAALDDVVQRHEILRTDLVLHAGLPVQRIHERVDVSLQQIGLLPGEIEPYVREAFAQPFTLDRAPLFRATLAELGRDDHLFLLIVHHIAFDGWSSTVFMQELRDRYAARLAGKEAAMEPPALQYADYALWQRRAAGAATEQARPGLAYWQSQLADAPLPLDLGRRPLTGSSGTWCRTFALPDATMARVDAAARRHKATPFMICVAACQALLFHYTGQRDIVIGTPVAGRWAPELEGLIGLFGNLLPLRTRVSGTLQLGDVIERTRRTCLDAYAHQETPFETMVEQARPAGEPNLTPVFQILLSYQDQPRPPLQLPDIDAEELPVPAVGHELPVALMIGIDRGRWRVDARIDDGTFEPVLLEQLPSHLPRVLDAFGQAGTRLSDVMGPDASTRRALIARATGPRRDEAASDLWTLIQERARRQPDLEAVAGDDRSLTHRDLITQAIALRQQLRAHGVGPGTIVGLCLSRSPALVTAMLATLSAGAAYVPLDPEFPADRLAYMIEDSRAALILTDARAAASIPASASRLRKLQIDRLAEAPIVEAPRDGLAVEYAADHLAYVIYTSGSTGTPKGVMVTRGALTNVLRSMADTPGLHPGDTWLAVTSLSFDIAALELLLPPLAGARVIVASSEVVADGARLGQRLSASGANVMQATPATWRMLLDAGWRPQPGLRILIGGEALPGALAARLVTAEGELWNLYGPTETTIWSCVRRVHAIPDLSTTVTVPIGTPIANTIGYVLNDALQLVPDGVIGELCLAGDGLALGYLGKPALTADRFRPDPFATRGGGRLYRTGDMVRRISADALAFLGRRDAQVKLRGHRIELAEIESALGAHPAVSAAVACVTVDSRQDQVLAAALVARPACARPSAGELRTFLRSRLPAYMIPSAWAWLDRLPLTPNRKIDRQALPPFVPMSVTADFVEPAGDAEQRLATIWCDVLNRDRIGARDNFFDLGVHSLTATQVAARVQVVFGVAMPVPTLFDHPTIAALAVAIADLPPNVDGPSAVQTKDELLRNLDTLSEDELDRYLASVVDLRSEAADR